jgi:hypothetical protein
VEDTEEADAEDMAGMEDMEVMAEDMAGSMEDMDLVDGVGDILIMVGIMISADWDTPASVVTAVVEVESILVLQ